MHRPKSFFVFSPYFHRLILLLFLLTLTPSCGASGGGGGIPPQELWCVAKNNAEDSDLTTALNWACGPGGADCSPIQNGGPCYDPSNTPLMASYAFNDYFLKHGLTDDSCSFSNTAAVTSLNPSNDKCKFPSSLSVSNGGVTGTMSSTSSSSSSSVGLEPSEDMSGGSKVSLRWWFWLLSISHLLLMVSVFG
ncbi:hypothetical protein HN51_011327 [Arachis hypogaea]|uniref:X8 domain-containing protein n=2 Tax=Arachis TaxID=3817 RepID=A0A445DZU0_ARAHY|nr:PLASMODESMATA CALLOSE-BINDING PROTEIN 5 [Arachis duranensis]XP_025687753.1 PLASMODESMATA CALLOSE-BINDING PROTEIN 5 [Arachis hypogaea]QHO56586.1 PLASMODESMATA CALLOSE-BINDING PROTEIN [Arachis hypogaea]RYR68656.1 hypothetical protein Ahy_A03g015142 [Arachis hypogaea]